MIRPPPRSTHFPYPTLFRSGVAAKPLLHRRALGDEAAERAALAPLRPRSSARRREALLGGTGRGREAAPPRRRDRKSTRLNSSHANISYAVFCLKKRIMASR